jgi:D-alanyl-D-alanine carboxypeptidase
MLVKSGGGNLFRGAPRVALIVVGALTLFFATVAPSLANPPFSAIAVDGRTGELLFSRDADGLRHPASLTKVMTLYLLFQDLKAKRISLTSPIRISRRAAAQAPSKLGVKPGQTLSVDTAIRALVTKSANDVAVAIAETLGGSEGAFAARMTRTARALGMARTTFRNASGLPDPSQWTTAHDMATLSLRIQRDFPQYYPYFAIRTFAYNGRAIRNHNRLLGRYDGIDGIKTGYIRASGFNLASSAKRGDRRIVGVVLGAPSNGYRNRYMTAMLDEAFPKCRNGSGIALAVGVKGSSVTVAASEAATAEAVAPRGKPVVADARDDSVEKAAQSAPAGTGDDDTPEDTADTTQGGTEPAASVPPPAQGSVFETVTAEASPPPAAALPAKLPFQVKTATANDAAGEVLGSDGKPSWNIQIGAFPSKEAAETKLDAVRKKAARAVAGKPGFTMELPQGKTVLYRARFAGFTQKTARAACRKIAAKGFGCLTFAPAS